MAYKRILTIQDISCVGQCSLTVALPVISACGIETCVMPSAVLSSHTGGFSGYTFRDLTDDMPKIAEHWKNEKKEDIKFDAIYTGYLGSAKQIEYVKSIFASVAKEGAPTIVDPAMADNGKLYYGFDGEFIKAMASLCTVADYVLPNLTEACLMTDTEFRTEYEREYIGALLAKLATLCNGTIILTGVSYREGYTGVVVYKNGEYSYYEHPRLLAGCHGTGDIYASAFTASLMRGKSAAVASRIAADFTLECIKETAKHENHWYGAAFEPVLYKLIEMVK